MEFVYNAEYIYVCNVWSVYLIDRARILNCMELRMFKVKEPMKKCWLEELRRY